MDAFLVATGAVALAEIGDKTQLLALLLSARWRRPLPIILGILVATLINHAGAAAVGALLSELLGAHVMRLVVGLAFLGMAIWTMIPDHLHAHDTEASRFGVFLITLIAFFVAEMGDKTQVATVALAAHYSTVTTVVIGTTLGMMLVNIPAVLCGERIANKLPLTLAHTLGAALFLILGISTLLGSAL